MNKTKSHMLNEALELLSMKLDPSQTYLFHQTPTGCPIAQAYKIEANAWEVLRLDDVDKLRAHGWTAGTYSTFIAWFDGLRVQRGTATRTLMRRIRSVK